MVMVSEREQLACLVQQWNENRLDLFHLSYPTEDLEVEGVMRFYFQVKIEFFHYFKIKIENLSSLAALRNLKIEKKTVKNLLKNQKKKLPKIFVENQFSV